MLCQRCHGKGAVSAAFTKNTPQPKWDQPCPDCHGLGVTHCCDGLVCQPETKK